MKKIFFIFTLVILSSLLTSAVSAETSTKDRIIAEWKAKLSTSNSDNALDLNCLQTALTTREKAISASYDTMSTSIKSALSTRQTELTAAWALTDNKARRTERKSAWDKFNKAVREAKKTYKTSVSNAWKQFHLDGKACKVTTQGVESSSSDLSL